MIFCTACGKQIHETAPTCPGCGAVQIEASAVASMPASSARHWMPITSAVLGVFCLLCTFDDSQWNKDEVTGFLIALVTSAALGLLAVGRKTGTAVAITGVALSTLALILFLATL